jgi:delta 1-pyrroline-5-carboxylate dehydrogenase
VVLVAETGGQNAMIVDSSALVEQAVQDIAASAFDSAGQRCSALRLLCVQNDCADRLLTMLRGAMQELHCGNPVELTTDVGPVIDADAKTAIERHIARLRALGLRIHQSPLSPETAAQGHFVAPTLIELPDLHQLAREVFGPVLHVLRYQRRELPQLLERINARLRPDHGIAHAHRRNRAASRPGGTCRQSVCESQYGGGRGRCAALWRRGAVGHRPQGRRPLYLPRLQQTPGSPLRLLSLLLHQSGEAQASATPVTAAAATALQQLGHWARQHGEAIVSHDCERLQSALPDLHAARLLPGPTGERTLLSCLASHAHCAWRRKEPCCCCNWRPHWPAARKHRCPAR